MIQAYYIYCALYYYFIVPFQIIKHYIPEAGDPRCTILLGGKISHPAPGPFPGRESSISILLRFPLLPSPYRRRGNDIEDWYLGVQEPGMRSSAPPSCGGLLSSSVSGRLTSSGAPTEAILRFSGVPVTDCCGTWLSPKFSLRKPINRHTPHLSRFSHCALSRGKVAFRSPVPDPSVSWLLLNQ